MRRILFLSLLLALLIAPAPAQADTPWFSQRGAERMVQQAMPEYYTYLQSIREKNPEKYLERLHQAMMLVHSGDENPMIIDAWRTIWDVEQRYMTRLEAWKVASPAAKTAIRAELLDLSREWEAARLALFEAKIPTFEDRLYSLELSLQDVRINADSYAEERVKQSLGE